MIERAELLEQVNYGLKRSPVTAVLGPRQCGKTTLGREIGALSRPALERVGDWRIPGRNASHDAKVS